MQFPQEQEQQFTIPGAIGRLEIITMRSQAQDKAVTAIICHPHPLHGGTMHNKVVHTIAKAFKDLGIKSVRFNFRGIGASEGSYGQGLGEVEDALAIVDWVKKVCPHDEIWLAGFSFGAYIAAQTATRISPAQLITIAPS